MNLKTNEKILNQMYLSAYDLKELIPEVGIDRCRGYINEVIDEMEEKKLMIPRGKKKLALTSLMKKKFGWK